MTRTRVASASRCECVLEASDSPRLQVRRDRKPPPTFTNFYKFPLEVESAKPYVPLVGDGAGKDRGPCRGSLFFPIVNPTLLHGRTLLTMESAMTKITLEIPETVTFNIARLETGIECDLSKAVDPQAAAMTIFNYGLRRYVNDATGGADMTDADRLQAAQEKVNRLLAGENRTGGGGPRLAPWVPVFRKTVVAFLIAQKLCKREEAEKVAVLSAAAIAGKIVEFKPAWNYEKVLARVDAWAEEAKRLAQIDTTDDLI